MDLESNLTPLEREFLPHELIYDWNVMGESLPPPQRRVMFDDETLRDGLQSPSVKTPSIEEKLRLLYLMDELGIDTANLGLPGAGAIHVEHITVLAREIRNRRLRIQANAACRTLVADVEPLVRICDSLGMAIEACTFIGSSPIRRYVEEWSLDTMLKNIEASVTFAVKHGLPVMFVTEDTTRADPETLRRLHTVAIECGAKRICLSDTVGHATPTGVKNLVEFAKQMIAATGEDVGIDFHGHNDRGLGVMNALAAASTGATRIHGTALGIGERCGNCSMDQLLVNMKLLGWIENDLGKLKAYSALASRATDTPAPVNYPVFGADASRTQAGVHAAAVIKAFKRGDDWLANRVYSGVPADLFGLKQGIEIGPMSGEHNVRFWLEQRRIKPTEETVKAIMGAAKEARRVMNEPEVREIVTMTSAPGILTHIGQDLGMTMAEKLLAAHAGLERVTTGQIINAQVDLVMANELSAQVAIKEFRKIKGATRVFDKNKVVIVEDHFVPNKDVPSARIARDVRKFAEEQGCIYFEVGQGGIEHVLLPEKGLVGPGDLVIGGDSHTCTYGALGAFATGVGSTDIAAAWALGEVWMKVPPTIKLVYNGKPKKWVSGKDLILYTIGKIGVDGARYAALEFTGDAFKYFGMGDRLTMANMAIEAGAKAGLFAVDQRTLAYVHESGAKVKEIYHPDPSAEYLMTYEFDVSEIEPQVAIPYLPSNTLGISQIESLPIDQVCIGFCTNGRIEDLRVAAQILKGRKVNPKTRTLIFPGSNRVQLQAMKEGLLQIFVEAGCAVNAPTCGPCIGGQLGVLAEGERCVSTSNRNFKGRMGAIDSEVYLASPAVAAATAVLGRIASPAEIRDLAS
ncbi:MAG: 3-isopropylmalate dehydratase large subunit [Chloroflexi bacterium]|nr:3-isopropylmalate dehydratase large subunit [Chloroflexota bacterium]